VVSRLPFSTKAQVQSQVGLCGNFGAQNGMERVYLRVRWFSPISIISRFLLHRRYIILLIDSVVKYGTPSRHKERRIIGFIAWPRPLFQWRDATNRKTHDQSRQSALAGRSVRSETSCGVLPHVVPRGQPCISLDYQCLSLSLSLSRPVCSGNLMQE